MANKLDEHSFTLKRMHLPDFHPLYQGATAHLSHVFRRKVPARDGHSEQQHAIC